MVIIYFPQHSGSNSPIQSSNPSITLSSKRCRFVFPFPCFRIVFSLLLFSDIISLSARLSPGPVAGFVSVIRSQRRRTERVREREREREREPSVFIDGELWRRREMAVSKVLLMAFSVLIFVAVLPAVRAQSMAPAPAPTSDGTTIDQGIAYVLMLVALVLTYIIH